MAQHIVQLIGGAATLDLTPPPLPDGAERWGLNGLRYRQHAMKFDDWTRWFDLHHMPHIIEKRPSTYEWYKQQTKPIILWQSDPLIPASEAYPREAVQLYFGKETLFLSSFDWLMALAIAEDFDVIDVIGFKMSNNEKYSYQIPSALYWVGRARGMGLTVNIHGNSNLKPNNKLYGYETVDTFEFLSKFRY